MDIKTDTKLKPKYFPHLNDETMPVVRDGMVETLAFILSGIDP